jgi:hypothetical protein
MCRDCKTGPAQRPECEDCEEHDGGCLRCMPCDRRAESRLTVGIIDLLWQGNDDATLTVTDTMAILSRCDVENAVLHLAGNVVGSRLVLEELGLETVTDWLAKTRARAMHGS